MANDKRTAYLEKLQTEKAEKAEKEDERDELQGLVKPRESKEPQKKLKDKINALSARISCIENELKLNTEYDSLLKELENYILRTNKKLLTTVKSNCGYSSINAAMSSLKALSAINDAVNSKGGYLITEEDQKKIWEAINTAFDKNSYHFMMISTAILGVFLFAMFVSFAATLAVTSGATLPFISPILGIFQATIGGSPLIANLMALTGLFGAGTLTFLIANKSYNSAQTTSYGLFKTIQKTGKYPDEELDENEQTLNHNQEEPSI